jgi:hypothetical protein
MLNAGPYCSSTLRVDTARAWGQCQAARECLTLSRVRRGRVPGGGSRVSIISMGGGGARPPSDCSVARSARQLASSCCRRRRPSSASVSPRCTPVACQMVFFRPPRASPDCARERGGAGCAAARGAWAFERWPPEHQLPARCGEVRARCGRGAGGRVHACFCSLSSCASSACACSSSSLRFAASLAGHGRGDVRPPAASVGLRGGCGCVLGRVPGSGMIWRSGLARGAAAAVSPACRAAAERALG